MTSQRWDGDERGEGVADATAFADEADELARTMRSPRWIAEEPDAHLLPHLAEACASLPFALVTAKPSEEGSFDLELHWTADEWGVGVVRAAVFALVGSVSEPSTYVRQRNVAAGEVAFDVVTGFVENDSEFAAHGHTLRIVVRQ